MKCTFFGHRDVPDDYKYMIKEQVIDMIENHNVDTFYVGHNGNFDALALNVLKEITPLYPWVKYYIVLAYLPTKKKPFDATDYEHTIYPEGLEKVPKRFAIDKRNRWMIENSDAVITYVLFELSCAYKYETIAKKKNKKVVNLIDILDEYMENKNSP